MELYELSYNQPDAFMRDDAETAKAIATAFNPTKINYGAYADTLSHMHIVPKYKEDYGFGGVFEMNPQKTTLSDAEYAEVIAKIKAEL